MLVLRLTPESGRLRREVGSAVRRVQRHLLEPLGRAARTAMLRRLAQLATVHNDVTPALRQAADRG